jgi:FkbM family methyltransferase
MVNDAPRGPIADGASGYRRPTTLERAADAIGRIVTVPALRRALKRVYLRALDLQTRGRGLPASLPGGETIRVLPEYAFLKWNSVEYTAFRGAVSPGATALDVGANVGAYTLLLARWVGETGAVFAFEPSPAVFAGLTRHIQLNDVTAIVRPVQSAVADVIGTLPFTADTTPGEGRLVAAGGESGATIRVPVTTIDEFCAREGIEPTFIKVDVEGAELDVLCGARDTIARTRGRLALFVEFHPSLWRTRGLSRADIERELAAQHLTIAPLAPDIDPWSLEGLCVRLIPAA